MSVNVLQQRTATQGYDIMGGGTPQPEEEEMDLYPTDGSPNPVTSNGIYDALLTKQDTLSFDSAPTDDSTNPVTSGGVYDALTTKQDKISFANYNFKWTPNTSDWVAPMGSLSYISIPANSWVDLVIVSGVSYPGDVATTHISDIKVAKSGDTLSMYKFAVDVTNDFIHVSIPNYGTSNLEVTLSSKTPSSLLNQEMSIDVYKRTIYK